MGNKNEKLTVYSNSSFTFNTHSTKNSTTQNNFWNQDDSSIIDYFSFNDNDGHLQGFQNNQNQCLLTKNILNSNNYNEQNNYFDIQFLIEN